ncbi:MAG: arsenite methyltransferase, partial [Candidatus Eisenbacteria bacterium]|nr:arsenite methyltransferase [Candidatus Eisenbacteria bacterium]
MNHDTTSDEIREAVRERYGNFAKSHLTDEAIVNADATDPNKSACCEPGADLTTWADNLYDQNDLGRAEKSIAELTLGCGNPIALAELRQGEHVLDLGSGAGLDCFLASKQVGATGQVIGVDMTPDMLALAEKNLEKTGVRNVEFRKGYLEELPVATGSIDVVISNCVLNLSPDKPKAFSEAFRVLKSGGRLRVSDVLWTREPTEAERNDMESWTGCVAGA